MLFSEYLKEFKDYREDDLMMIDANDGVTDQDAKILGEAHEAGKGIIIVVNKWDIIEKDNHTMQEYKNNIYNKICKKHIYSRKNSCLCCRYPNVFSTTPCLIALGCANQSYQ